MSSVAEFLSQSWAELKKVVWLSREKTIRLTLVVLAVSLGVAGFVAAMDYLFDLTLGALVGR